MARYDDINTPAIVLVGIISAIVVFALVVGVGALYFNYQQVTTTEQNTRSPDVKAANLIAEQEARLKRRGWLDREAGRVAIPIDLAMKLVVKELRAEQQIREPGDE